MAVLAWRAPWPRTLIGSWDAHLDACPGCRAHFPAEAQTPQNVYDRIELPPVRPDVTRVRLFGGRCACCGVRGIASAPAGLEPGSPFGRSIESMVVYLHYGHAIGLERLRALMGEVFGRSISKGAWCNILARARAPLDTAAATIAATVREARVVCSDETSVRVAGKTWWEWVFVTGLAVLHVIRPSRGQGRAAGGVRGRAARRVGVGCAGQPARARRTLADVPRTLCRPPY